MTRLSKTLIAGALVLGFSSNVMAECEAPSSPIIPDGNVASQDELIAAQGAFKAFEKNFYDFRDCLQEKEKAILPDAEDAEEQKAAIVEADNVAFDELNRVADKFNAAVRAFKAR